MRRLIAAVLATSACTSPEPNAYLADLPGLGVQAYSSYWLEDDVAGPPTLSVWIEYDQDAFATRAGTTSCATLHELHGSYNGARLELASAGGASDGSCDSPLFETRLRIDDEVGVLEVSDAMTTIRATYAAGSLVPRRAILAGHEDWEVAPGEAVTAHWSHSSDLTSTFEVTLSADQGPAIVLAAEPDPATGEISFQVPTERPRYRTHVITFDAGDDATSGLHTQAESCVGAERCTYSPYASFMHYLLIQ